MQIGIQKIPLASCIVFDVSGLPLERGIGYCVIFEEETAKSSQCVVRRENMDGFLLPFTVAMFSELQNCAGPDNLIV